MVALKLCVTMLIYIGIFTIVRYGRLLLKQLATSGGGMFSSEVLSPPKNDDRKIFEQMGNITMQVGKAGSEGGHTAEASSYFDRLILRCTYPHTSYVTYYYIHNNVYSTTHYYIHIKHTTLHTHYYTHHDT